MKAVMISIQPKWCELIASGKKTIEVRKTAPKLKRPFKCYIYCTQGKVKDLFSCGDRIYQNRMKVIGEFTCRGMMGGSSPLLSKQSCLTPSEIFDYSKGKRIYGWRIADLVIYDKPRELSEFSKYGFGRTVPLKRPPQSWMYVEVK